MKGDKRVKDPFSDNRISGGKPVTFPHGSLIPEQRRQAASDGGHGYFPGGVYTYEKMIRPQEVREQKRFRQSWKVCINGNATDAKESVSCTVHAENEKSIRRRCVFHSGAHFCEKVTEEEMFPCYNKANLREK